MTHRYSKNERPRPFVKIALCYDSSSDCLSGSAKTEYTRTLTGNNCAARH